MTFILICWVDPGVGHQLVQCVEYLSAGGTDEPLPPAWRICDIGFPAMRCTMSQQTSNIFKTIETVFFPYTST